METYMREEMGIPSDQVAELRQRYYKQYGTTLRGLQAEMDVDTDGFLGYVHNLPVAEYLTPDPGLPALIKSIPGRRWVFTNSDSTHAVRVLNALNLVDCFSGIIDVRAMDFKAKPDPAAYSSAFDVAGAVSPSSCVIFEDSPRNLAAARSAGWFGVYIGKHAPEDGITDLAIGSWYELPDALPDLWLGEE